MSQLRPRHRKQFHLLPLDTTDGDRDVPGAKTRKGLSPHRSFMTVREEGSQITGTACSTVFHKFPRVDRRVPFIGPLYQRTFGRAMASLCAPSTLTAALHVTALTEAQQLSYNLSNTSSTGIVYNSNSCICAFSNNIASDYTQAPCLCKVELCS